MTVIISDEDKQAGYLRIFKESAAALFEGAETTLRPDEAEYLRNWAWDHLTHEQREKVYAETNAVFQGKHSPEK